MPASNDFILGIEVISDPKHANNLRKLRLCPYDVIALNQHRKLPKELIEYIDKTIVFIQISITKVVSA